MNKPKQKKDRTPTIRELYPELNEEQLEKVEDNLDRYIESTLRVYERLLADPEAYAQFKSLTKARNDGMDEMTK